MGGPAMPIRFESHAVSRGSIRIFPPSHFFIPSNSSESTKSSQISEPSRCKNTYLPLIFLGNNAASLSSWPGGEIKTDFVQSQFFSKKFFNDIDVNATRGGFCP